MFAKGYWLPLVLLLSLFAKPAFALGQNGHELVCQLAYDLLSTDKQAQVTRLINQMPAQEIKRLDDYQRRGLTGAIDRPMSFARACVWPDTIKRDENYKHYNSWHYINVARTETQIKPQSCAKDCITRAIEVHQKALKTAKDNWDRTRALMFLGHWLGDIHQPLHVSYASDWGGNKLKIRKFSGKSRCTSLHFYWDVCLLESRGLDYAQLLDYFRKRVKTADINALEGKGIYHWASESLYISRLPSVGYCTLKVSGECAPVTATEQSPLVLSNGYAQKHWPVYEQQLIKASVRLAKLLDASL